MPTKVIKPILNLSNVNGNAFMIMALAKKAAKRAGWTDEKIERYISQAKSGDYDHLLEVTQQLFEVI